MTTQLSAFETCHGNVSQEQVAYQLLNVVQRCHWILRNSPARLSPRKTFQRLCFHAAVATRGLTAAAETGSTWTGHSTETLRDFGQIFLRW